MMLRGRCLKSGNGGPCEFSTGGLNASPDRRTKYVSRDYPQTAKTAAGLYSSESSPGLADV